MSETESMLDYKDELERSFRKLSEGDLITGTILSISEEDIFVDLKYYTQGVLPVTEITDDPAFVVDEKYHVGDEITATITKMDDGMGNILLSIKEANQVLSWDVLKAAMDEEKQFPVKIAEIVNGGVIAYLEGIRGFIPASQLSGQYVENLQEWEGKTVKVQVITVNEEDNRLVMSARKVLDKEQAEEKSRKIANLVPGSVFEGVVESIKPYGAFISLEGGLSGLVHISRISQRRLKSPSEVLKEGQHVKVKLIDCKDGKLSLSMKEFEDILDVEADTMETFDYEEKEEATTSLGALLKGLKL
ncbi:MAG: S1 RNA-binding domain-containing protein [Lachnospiraceae bacterium]|nr:S1 RNA-binding domain-containing protein [Lachnospiraceae bacterium]